MRELVIQKILEYKNRDGGFNPATMRWNRGGTKRNPGNRFCINGKHYCEVDWNGPHLSDEVLLEALTTIVWQCSKQM
jgi:hypothetical protein